MSKVGYRGSPINFSLFCNPVEFLSTRKTNDTLIFRGQSKSCDRFKRYCNLFSKPNNALVILQSSFRCSIVLMDLVGKKCS